MESVSVSRKTRRATHVEASNKFSNTDRQAETFSICADFRNQGGRRDTSDSLVKDLLDSDDELSDGLVDGTPSRAATSLRLDQFSQDFIHNADVTAGAAAQLAIVGHLDDSAQIPSHEGAADHAKVFDQLSTGREERSRQSGEDDLSLREYISNQSTWISSKLQRLEATVHNCDKLLGGINNSDRLEESNLKAHRKDTETAKERLNKAQQVEQKAVGMQGMGEDEDDTSNKKFLNFLKATSEWRESLEVVYEEKEASLKAMETKANTRQEEIFRVEQEKQNASIKLHGWKEWKDNEGKIFPH